MYYSDFLLAKANVEIVIHDAGYLQQLDGVIVEVSDL